MVTEILAVMIMFLVFVMVFFTGYVLITAVAIGAAFGHPRVDKKLGEKTRRSVRAVLEQSVR